MGMKTKLFALACTLISHANLAMAHEIGSEIYDKYEGARIFGNIGVIAREGSARDQVDIYAVSKKFKHNPQNFSEALRASTQTIDKKLWTITLDQLPITEDDCWNLTGDICYENEKNCYQYCIKYPDPRIVAFDEKNQKVYLKYPTKTIGVTGEGPALLFVADINKRIIKLIGRGPWLGEGSLSPSGRYLALYSSSIIHVYDTQTNSWFDINKPRNNYSSHPEVRHSLDLKQWNSDTQFIYVDVGRYFTPGDMSQPFISAKETTYDISTKSKLSEKAISEKEYEQIIKDIRHKE